MNLKRYAGPAYFAANAVALVASVRRARGGAGAELGAILAHGAPLAFLVSLYARRRGRASRDLLPVRAATAAGTALTGLTGPGRRGRALVPGVLAVAGTEMYLRWYARLDREESAALGVGARLPDDIAFVDVDGRTVTAADLRGRPTALLFYRGNWCPLCVGQVTEMAARWRDLEALGVDVALVSPQDDEHTRALAERFAVGFRYLRDPGLAAAARLGILHEGGVPPGMPGYEPDTVFPTVVVTDATGRIVMSDQTDDYRVRPEPETILAALRAVA